MDDSYDDPDGYYRFRRGDVIGGRYVVVATQGTGVFSTVVRVHDQNLDNRELVVKIIRNKETMLKAGMKGACLCAWFDRCEWNRVWAELEFLNTLCSRDPENKKHIVRLMGQFEHKGHLCLVFEPLYKNLREVHLQASSEVASAHMWIALQLLRKLGNVGLHIRSVSDSFSGFVFSSLCMFSAVRTYAKQLFTALLHMQECRILHADIKPDNILVCCTVALKCGNASAL